MNRSLFGMEIIPFLKVLGALMLAAAACDGILHLLDMAWVGRYLGIPGTLLILTSFLYSLRKRRKISWGDPRMLLRLHQVLTWLGALMILLHAGIHAWAILPWLALIAMLINVVSGMVGARILDRSRQFIEAKRADYVSRGLPEAEIDRQMFWDATTFDLMRRWRSVHLPITLAFALLSLMHIVSILMFWEWR